MSILEFPSRYNSADAAELEELDEFFKTLEMDFSAVEFHGFARAHHDSDEEDDIAYGVQVEDLSLEEWMYTE